MGLKWDKNSTETAQQSLNNPRTPLLPPSPSTCQCHTPLRPCSLSAASGQLLPPSLSCPSLAAASFTTPPLLAPPPRPLAPAFSVSASPSLLLRGRQPRPLSLPSLVPASSVAASTGPSPPCRCSRLRLCSCC